MAAMIGRYDALRLSSIQMRTPVRYDPVAAVGGIPATPVTNDGIVRDVIRDRQCVQRLDKLVFGRKGIDARREVRLSCRVSGCYDVLRCVQSHRNHVAREFGQSNPEPPYPISGQTGTAVRGRAKNHPAYIRSMPE